MTVSYFEWVQDMQQFMWSEEQVNEKLQELMLGSFKKVRKRSRERKISMRQSALSIGVEKVSRKIQAGPVPVTPVGNHQCKSPVRETVNAISR